MLQPSTLQFLKNLKQNNNKPWFDAHRKIYEAAKTDFASFIQQVIDILGEKDNTISNIIAKDCLFRINRDVRFSKNKDPYKNNFGASINKGGRKAFNTAGYYFHLEPGASFVGGGIYMPDAETLRKIRQEIDYNLPDFKKIISHKKFKSAYGNLSHEPEYTLQRVPKGYDADNPAAEYLKLKSFVVFASLSDKELTDKKLLNNTVQQLEALSPFIHFINNATI